MILAIHKVCPSMKMNVRPMRPKTLNVAQVLSLSVSDDVPIGGREARERVGCHPIPYGAEMPEQVLHDLIFVPCYPSMSDKDLEREAKAIIEISGQLEGEPAGATDMREASSN